MASYIPKTAPDPNETGWPTGVPYIIGNEGCERFSFYGMKSILQVHLTALFVIAGIGDELASETHAQEMVHLFIAGVYAFPMIGAIVADRLWGKYNTILALSIVYCAGHAVLAVGENSIMGMYIGLGLIAIGSGGIKPCVSAHVGDQFGKGNWPLVTKVFQAFYWIINFGSFFATLAIPYLNKNYGTGVAFGLPGILMALATIWFWMGRKKFVHIPARPGGRTGALDAVSGSLLFMGFIGLPMFFTSILGPIAFWATMAGCIGLGLWLFSQRQKIEEDDGFLAVMLHGFNGRRRRQRR
jgi:POT family proton-dependent oligopeptide transporter